MCATIAQLECEQATKIINAGASGDAIDMARSFRINTVSPNVLAPSRELWDGFFRGHQPVPNVAVGLAYSKAVEGCPTGQVFAVDLG